MRDLDEGLGDYMEFPHEIFEGLYGVEGLAHEILRDCMGLKV